MTIVQNARRHDVLPAGNFYLKTDFIYFLLTVLLAGLVYRLKLCPTVEYIDSGELALACKNLGIAHPTGYPLYTLLGRLGSFLFPGELIIKMNMMSLIFTALASGFLFLCIAEFKSILGMKDSWGKLTAFAVALFGALTPIWWSQGTTNEVYSLNLLLISISIFALLNHLGKNSFEWLMISAYALGLALANHLSAAYILPAYVALLIYRWRRRKLKAGVLYFCVLFFLFPLTIYIFLPIRATFSPFLNWGGVSDPYFLYKHISGWQYRIWMFTDFSMSSFIDKMISSVSLVYRQFGWPGFLLCAFGIIIALTRKTYLAVFALSIIALNFLYATNYEIIDIESYYLPMITILSIFAGTGAGFIIYKITTATKKNTAIKYIILTGILILPVFGLIANFHISDRGSRIFPRQSVMDMIDSMEPGGLAFVENWDFYSPWLYFHFEDNLRQDIVLLDKELMRRSWYIDFIKRKHPEIYQNSAPAIEDFLRKVEPFERSRPFDATVIDKAYYNMLHAITINEMTNRPVYTNILTDKKFTGVLPLIPAGMLFKIDGTSEFYETGRFEFKRELWGNKHIYRDRRVGVILSYYKNAFSSREKYCRFFGKEDEAGYYKKMTAEVSTVISEIVSNK